MRFESRLLVLGVALGVTGGCGPEGDEQLPAGRTVETLANGARHVRYGTRPEVPVWNVREVMRIGSLDGPVEASFGMVVSTELMPDGGVVAIDGQNDEIRRFSAAGEYIETIARAGEGPREVSNAGAVREGPDGTLWVIDQGNRRYTGFRPDGSLITLPREINGFTFQWAGAVTNDGWIWDLNLQLDIDEMPSGPGLVTTPSTLWVRGMPTDPEDLEPVLDIDRARGEDALEARDALVVDSAIVDRWESRMIMMEQVGFPPPMDPPDLAIIDPAGFVWTGLGDAYHLTKHTLPGDTVLVVEMPPVLVEVTPQERDSIAARYDRFQERFGESPVDLASLVPLHHHAMLLWVVDDESNLWVQRRDLDRSLAWDVISAEGELLAVARTDFESRENFLPRIRDRHMLAVVTDELDVQYIVKAVIER